MNIHHTIHEFFIHGSKLAHDRKSIEYEEQLIEGGLIDSTDILELIAFLEEKYDITFEEDEITAESFSSINSIAQMVDNHLTSQN